MRSALNSSSSYIKLGKTLVAGALISAAPLGMVSAAGLGKINVLSRYGQPFVAEIDLINVTRDELGTLNAGLAPTSAYQANNLRFDPSLNSLRMSVERRANGTHYVRATTTRRVDEPYIDLVVDLTWQGGKFQRHYSALMDLPMGPEAASAATAQAAANPAVQSAPAAPAARTVVPSAAVDATAATEQQAQKDKARGAKAPRARNSAAANAAVDTPPVKLGQAAVPAIPAASVGPVSPATTPRTGAAANAATTSNNEAAKAGSPQPAVKSVEAAKPLALDPAKAEAPGAASTAASKAAPAEGAAPAPAAIATTPPAQTEPPKPEVKEATVASAAPTPPAAPAPPPKKSTPAAVEPEQQSGFMAGAMKYLLLVGGVLLALVLGFIGFVLWRRRRDSDSERELEQENLRGAPDAHVAAVQSVPSPAFSDVATGATLPAMAVAAVTEEPEQITVSNSSKVVDPLDEAKVYVAYGQYDEAEKVLRAALSKQRGREDVQVTLLEILAEQGDKEGFHKIAGDMHKRTGGRGENWKRVAAMGYVLDPAHPLYPPTAEAAEAAEAARRAGNAAIAAETEVVEFDLTTPEGQAEALASQGISLPRDRDSVTPDDAKTLGRAGVETVSTTPPPASDIVIEFPQAAEPVVGAAEEPSASKDHAPLDFKVDFPKIDLTPPLASAPAEPRDAGLEFKLEAPGAAPLETPAEAANDIPRITDDLPALSGALPSGIDGGFDTGAPAHDEHWHDVQQKFDLVRAYQEMGDTDGVREVLGEIEAEGDAQQKAEARKRLLVLAET